MTIFRSQRAVAQDPDPIALYTILENRPLIIKIQEERRQIKSSGNVQPQAIQQLIDRANALSTKIFDRTLVRKVADHIDNTVQKGVITEGRALEIMKDYSSLYTDLNLEQRKLAKLLKKAIATQDLNAHSQNKPVQISLMEKACIAFRENPEHKGMDSIRELVRTDAATAGKIFGHVWSNAGSPTRKTKPEIAHGDFGRVAFFNEEGRSVPLAEKLKAVNAVLEAPSTALPAESIRLLEQARAAFRENPEHKGMDHIRELVKTDAATAGKIFGHVWVNAGSPTRKTKPEIAHDNFGRVAFFNEEGRSVPLADKLKAVDAVLRELSLAPPQRTVNSQPSLDDAIKSANFKKLGMLAGNQTYLLGNDEKPTYARIDDGAHADCRKTLSICPSWKRYLDRAEDFSYTPIKHWDGRPFGTSTLGSVTTGGFFLIVKTFDEQDKNRSLSSRAYALKTFGNDLEKLAGMPMAEIQKAADKNIDAIVTQYFTNVVEPKDGDLVIYSIPPGEVVLKADGTEASAGTTIAGIYRKSTPNWNSAEGGTVELKLSPSSRHIFQQDFFFLPVPCGSVARVYRLKTPS